MIRQEILQVPRGEVSHSIDWNRARKAIRIRGHKVIIEMLPALESIGGILLTESVGIECRPDFGVVLASQVQPQQVRGHLVFAPRPGDIVGVMPDQGVWIENALMGDYEPQSQVRVYGVYAEAEGTPQTCNWWDQIVVMLDGQTLVPLGDKIVIKLDTEIKTESGIYLPDVISKRTGFASVERVGPLVDDLRQGDRVAYSSDLLLENGLKVDGSDFAVCDDRAILYALGGA